MNKPRVCSSFLLITLVIVSLVVAANTSFTKAGAAGTSLPSYIITQDTTWTQSGSPYTLTGPLAVAAGVTLTIDPGVTVNLGTYCLTVNGTLVAQGTSDQPIYFNAGDTPFATLVLNAINSSNSIGSGGVFEHTVISTYGFQVCGGSPEFMNSEIAALELGGNSPLLVDNTITESLYVYSGSPQISNNQIDGVISVQGGSPVITGNIITTDNTDGAARSGQGNYSEYYGIQITPTQRSLISATIINDTISAGVYVSNPEPYWSISAQISNDTIAGGITTAGGNAAISDNTISGGISILAGAGGGYTITNNVISDASTAGIYMEQAGSGFNGLGWVQYTNSAVIERNLITNNQNGLQLADSATVENNTITNDSTAVYLQNAPTLSFNNIEGYTQNSVYILSGGANVTATNNWWGTTNEQVINQTVHDSKYDYNLGTVNYIPLLTAPNSQAMPDLNLPLSNSTAIPTPPPTTTQTSPTEENNTPSTPSPSPATTPNQVVEETKTPQGQSWTQTALIAAMGVIIALVIAVITLARKRTTVQNEAYTIS